MDRDLTYHHAMSYLSVPLVTNDVYLRTCEQGPIGPHELSLSYIGGKIRTINQIIDLSIALAATVNPRACIDGRSCFSLSSVPTEDIERSGIMNTPVYQELTGFGGVDTRPSAGGLDWRFFEISVRALMVPTSVGDVDRAALEAVRIAARHN